MQAFNTIAGDFIRFINFTIPEYATNPNIGEIIVTDCVRLYAAMIPPVSSRSSDDAMNLTIPKEFHGPILGALDAYTTNDAILPEILTLLDNLAT